MVKKEGDTRKSKKLYFIAFAVFLIVIFSLAIYALPFVGFTSSTIGNGTSISNTSVIINTSIIDGNLGSIKYNWNGTNYTMYNSSLALMFNFGNLSSLGENDTFVVDASSHQRNVSCSECPVLNQSGRYGSAYTFNRSGYFFTTTAGLGFTSAQKYTIEFWIKPVSSQYMAIIGISQHSGTYGTYGMDINKNSDGKIELAMRQGGGGNWFSVTSTTQLINNSWNHVALVSDGSTVTPYINGVVNTGSSLGSFASYTPYSDYLSIGTTSWGGNNINGTIDEIKIWKRTLSASEIYQEYVSNVQRAGLNQWYLYINQSKNATAGLSDGRYTCQVFATNTSGDLNLTDIMTLDIDSSVPQINFTISTPTNATATANTSVPINVSIYEANISSIIYNWNGTNYTIYNNSLILMMNLDNRSTIGENLTYAVDSSGRGNNGTITSGPIWNSSGKYSGSIYLNGSDHIDLGNPTDLANLGQRSYTIEAWVKTSNTDTRQTVIGNYDSTPAYVLELYTTGNLRMYVNNVGYNSATEVDDGAWHHIVGVRDYGNNILMYVDGKQIYNYGSDPTGSFTVTHNTMIGRNPSTSGYALNFVGNIDEVKIWNRSLSALEIYEEYISSLQKFNSTQWYFYVNQSKNSTVGLIDGNYTYQTFVKDFSGNFNLTEQRTININSGIDTTAPQINFTIFTPTNATATANTSVYINASIIENSISTIIYNWNGSNFTIYNDSLVLMMNFDNKSSLGENSTYVVDVSSYGNNGSCSGGTCPTLNSSGKYDKAYSFTGTQYFSIQPTMILNFTSSCKFTESVWIYPTLSADGGYHGVLGYETTQRQPSLWVFNQTRIHFGFGNGSTWCSYLPENNVITNNAWNYVTLTFNGTDSSAYINGVLFFTNNSYGATCPRPSYSGMDIGRVDNYFNGSIDEVRIWNRTLSASEIYEQYISNLQKYNSTQWYLYVNQSKNSTAGLNLGNYTYQAFARDNSGNFNLTEQRTITIQGESDTTYPILNFTTSTPVNTTNTTNTSVQINVSIIEENLNSLVYNWNGTNYTIYNNSLVLMMNFDNRSLLLENSSIVVDVSRYGNNGTVYGATWNSTGKYGGAYQFDGNDYIDCGNANNLRITNNISISTWVKSSSFSSARDFLGYMWHNPDSGILLGFNPTSSTIHVPFSNGASFDYLDATYDVSDNNWHNILITFSSGTIRIYADGILRNNKTSSTVSSIGYNPSYYTYVGRDSGGSGEYWVGSIDEIRVWNKTLSTAEVYQQYISNLNRFNQTQWHFYVNQSKNATDGLSDGNYTYKVFASDTSGNFNSSEQRSLNIFDTTYPIFSNYDDNNATLVASGIAIFNVTILNTNRTVWFEINGFNYTSANISANVWNYSLNLVNGTYSYRWWAYGSGSSKNLNSSELRYYTINNTPTLPSILTELIYPTGNINVTQNEFFNFTVNVSCFYGYCGGVNVTLDPTIIYNFTTCGVNGRYGPNQTQCNTNYTNTTLEGMVSVANGTQNWTVPSTGSYRIEVYGAQGATTGGYVGGFGAKTIGTFNLNAGQVIKIIVGQQGVSSTYAGGGGGSFVTLADNTPLIISGGGGAANGGGGYQGRNATTNTSGDIASNGGTPSTNGSGGTVTSSGSSGGGGLLSNGKQSTTSGNGPGLSFINWSYGGASQNGGAGGFGGGAGGDGTSCGMGGPGGGYSGGSCGSCSQSACGGGGSYNNGEDQNNSIRTTSGIGYITITYLGSEKSGTVSMNISATPFYTNITNPYNLTLSENQSTIITWFVNATGTPNIPYEFFVYANKTSNLSIGDDTLRLNITIKDITAPTIDITYPLNTTYNYNVNLINYTYYDYNGNSSCWFSNNSGIWNSSAVISGINFTNLTSNDGSNTWTVYCNDSSGNLNSTSVTFLKRVPRITTEVIYPTGNINVTQTEFFNVSVNVSCFNGNCGEINVTLDPETNTVYNFTTCGITTGKYGPNQTQCNTNYTGTNLAGLVSVFNGTQNFTVPYTGTYRIEAWGSVGGLGSDSGVIPGKGAYIRGDYELSAGTVIKVLVGQKPNPRGSKGYGVGGGGGSFVVLGNNAPLIVAGGGGGSSSGQSYNRNGMNASINTSGTSGNQGYSGGTNGNGGTGSSGSWGGGGGAGLLGNGGSGYNNLAVAQAFVNGGYGGSGYDPDGGFGGGAAGGGGAGGGGGYSGGGGANDYYAGGGGGSYNNGTNQINTSGVNNETGKVSITFIGSRKGGTVSTNSSATPFYTNITNPYNLTLGEEESQIITWFVNATGTPNTPYEFFIYANMTNNMSVSNQTAGWNVTIKDIVSPVINITYPLNTTYIVNVSAVSYNYLDYTGNGYCWYSNNSGIWNSSAVSSGTNFTNVITVDGTNYITIWCNDSSGNLADSSSVIFFRDTVYPIFSGTYDSNATINGSGVARFNVTILNTNRTVLLEINGTNYTANNISLNVWNYSLILTNATYEYKWISFGNGTLNNINVSIAKNYTLFGNLEILNVTSYNYSGTIFGNVSQGGNVTINATVQNAANILLKIWRAVIGSQILWQGFMSNVFGNVWSATILTNTTWPTGEINYTIFANDSLKNQHNLSGNFTVLDTRVPDIYLIYPQNRSYVKNATQYFSINISENVGLTNATIYVWNSTNAEINVTIANVTGSTNSTNISVTLPYDDVFKWNYYVCDNSSNCGWNSSNFTVTYDSIPPRVNITYPLNNTYNVNVRWINYTYSDLNSNGSCWYSNNSGVWNSSTVSSTQNYTNTNSSEGDNIWTLYCNDSANNINSSTINFVKDTPHMIINRVYPAENIDVGKNFFFNVTVNVTCFDANCGEINVTLDPNRNVVVWEASGDGGGDYAQGSQAVGQAIATAIGGTLVTTKPSGYGATPNNSIWDYDIIVASTSASNTAFNSTLMKDAVSNGKIVISSKPYMTSVVSSLGLTNIYLNTTSTSCDGFTPNYVNYSCHPNGGMILADTTNYQGCNWEHGCASSIGAVFAGVINNNPCRGKTGTVSTNSTATPFYTNITNPYNLNLSENESLIITWYVNATGSYGNYTFFVYSNKTEDLTLNNLSTSWNVTIFNLTYDTSAPVINLTYPLNGSGSSSSTNYFGANFTEDIKISNSTLYVWNSSSAEINSTLVNLSGIFNQSNISVTLNYNDIFKWNYYSCDNSSNCGFSQNNFTFIYDTVSPYFTNASNTWNYDNESLLYDINASDLLQLNNFAINWTTNFTINSSSGVLRNSSRLIIGDYYINITINDSANNINSTVIYFEVRNYSILDRNYPGFDNYSDNNNSITSGGLAIFNATILSTNGTAWISINGTNYYATNLTANMFNVSVLGILEGTYIYNWSSYGNGTSKNINISENRYYYVLPAPPTTAINLDWVYPQVNINATQNEFFNVTFNVTCLNGNCGEINVTLDPAVSYATNSPYDSGTSAASCKENGASGTIDSCSDGTSCSYPFKIERVYIVDLNNSEFTAGDTINVTFTTNTGCCGPDLVWAYSNNTVGGSNFKNKGYTADISSGLKNYSRTFVLDNIEGNHTIRGISVYSYATSSTTCGYSQSYGNSYSDTDDVIIYVRASSKGGIVSMNPTATPFYTNITNPYTLTLDQNESQIISWFVNATGRNPNTPYEFFVYANLTANMSVKNISTIRNITIKDIISPRVNITYPLNTSYAANITTINYTYSDYSTGGSCWYSNNSGVWNSSILSAGQNFTGVNLSGVSSTVTVYCNDSSGNLNSTSVTFSNSAPKVGLQMIYPTENIYVNKSYWFNVTVNVSCSGNDCRKINVSLDPEIYPSQCTNYVSLNWDDYNVNQSASSACTSTLTSRWYRLTGNYNEIAEQRSYITGICGAGSPGFLNFSHPATPGNTTNGSICYHWNNDVCKWKSSNVYVTRCSNYYVYYLTPSPTCSLQPCTTNAIADPTPFYTKSGLVLRNTSATPFYTNVENPYPVILSNGESQVITWFVNATGTINGTYEFFVYANLTNYTWITNTTSHWNVTITNGTSPAVDFVYPKFSNYSDNNGIIDHLGVSYFNATVNNTNGTVWFLINNTNITATNLSLRVYNVTYNFTGNGTYAYVWYSYGNGNLTNLNSSNPRNVTVSLLDATPPTVTINSPGNSSYRTTVINFNATTNENSSCFYSIDQNSNVSMTQFNITYYNYTNSAAPEGSHNVIFSCIDASGNTNSSSIRFFVDTIPPQISFSSPQNTSYNTKTILINILNNSDSKNIWFNRGLGNETYTTSVSKSFGEGSTSIIAYANDSLGNLNGTAVRFFVDSIAPTITISSPIEITYETKTINFNVSASEDSYCWFTINSTSYHNLENNGNRYFNYTITFPADGTYTVNYYCNDSLNNTATKSVLFGIDTIPPQITLNSPASNKYYKNSTVQFNYTPVASDGLGTCELWGNWTIDWHKNETTTTLSNNLSNYFIKTLNDGTYKWNIWCNNSLGENDWSTQGNITFTIDNTLPYVSFVYPRGISYNTSIVSIEITNNTDSDSIWWNNGSINLTYSSPIDVNLPDGNYTFTAYSNDSAGNLNQSEINFQVDTSYPGFFNFSSNNASLVGSGIGLFNITVNNTNGTVILNISGLEIAAIYLTGNIYHANYTFLTNDTYVYNWTSYSNGTSNLLAVCENQYYTVNNTDVYSPNATLVLPENNSYTNESIVNFTANLSDRTSEPGDTESGIANATVNIYNSSGIVNQTTENYSPGVVQTVVGIPVMLVDGIYSWFYRLIDYGGNIFVSENKTFTKDTVSPAISLTYPLNNSELNDNPLRVLYSVSDINLNSCWYIDQAGYSLEVMIDECNTAEISNLMEGDHNLTIFVNDSSGNINSSTVSFFMDTTDPEVTLNSPEDQYFNDTLHEIVVEFNCSSTDNRNLKNISLYITDDSNQNFELRETNLINGTDNSSSFTLNLLHGNYTWNCLSYDAVGNSNFAESNRTLSLNFTDSDNDVIPDNEDHLQGNESNVNERGVEHLNITVEGNTTYGSYNETREVAFFDSNKKIMNFTHNFSDSPLDLNNITIIAGNNSVIVNLSGQLQLERKKTLYIDDNNFVSLCVKDAEIDNISEMTSDCSDFDETNFTSCLGNDSGVTIGDLTCTDEGSRIRVDNLLHSAIRGTPATTEEEETIITTPSPGGSGGSSIPVNKSKAGNSLAQCLVNEDCKKTEYCFKNKCYPKECTDNSQCSNGKSCWDFHCVKLFDIKILDIGSAIGPGNFITFKYFLKGMANISNDVIIDFWLEKDEKKITSGKDTIFIGDLDEKTEEARLFIPRDAEPGEYNLYVTVTYEKYSAESHRQIEIDKNGNVASSINNILLYIIPLLIIISILLVIIVARLERKKLKNLFEYEEEWVLTHKLSRIVLLLCIGIIAIIWTLASLKIIGVPHIDDYLLNFENFAAGLFSGYTLAILGILAAVSVAYLIIRLKRKRVHKYNEHGKFVPKRRNRIENGLRKIRQKIIQRRIERKIKVLEKKGYDVDLIEKNKLSEKDLLEKWKRKGYDVDSIEKDNKSQKEKIEEWKKKGYDVGSLER